MICSHCCGTKRRIFIACPDGCVWLGAHASSWDGRETERLRDARRLVPHLEGLSEGQGQLFFLALSGFPRLRARRPELSDHLLHVAVVALRKTVQTRERGILYEHPAEDLRAQGLVAELRGLFEAKDAAGTAHAPDDRDLLAVLEALEASLEESLRGQDGPTAFLDTVARVAGPALPAARSAPAPLIVQP